MSVHTYAHYIHYKCVIQFMLPQFFNFNFENIIFFSTNEIDTFNFLMFSCVFFVRMKYRNNKTYI